ncbi:MAG: FAD-binding oxidoreductase, partial [Pseudomonadota bacterium]
RALRKDNTGYDLKQLFIGAEGTLGLVTGAVLKLVPRPEDRAVAFAGFTEPANAVRLLNRAQSASGGLVTSFELIPRIGIELDEKNIPGCRDPLTAPFPWYALVELAAGRGAGLRGVLEALLAEALDDGVIADAAIVENETQAEDFWRLRHSLSASMKPEGGCIKHDVSVPVEKVPAFLAAADAAVTAAFPGARIVAFGHLGDGNIHYDVCRPLDAETEAFLARWEEMQRIVHDIVAGFDGSISAEHGLGRMKRDEITRYKSQVELDMMRAVKAAFDPQGLMNPGKVL